MEITEEQRRRAEANRLAALAKRKALVESSSEQQRQKRPPQDPWKLFKCRKLIPEKRPAGEPVPIAEKFRVRLEICSPDSFSAAPGLVAGNPGEEECLRRLSDCLSEVIPSHYTQNHGGGKACVYKLRDYDSVLRCLKRWKSIEVEEIPWGTLNVVERLSHSFIGGKWIPCRPEHLPDEKVDEFIGKLPKTLLDALLPFQLEGVRFGLQRGGRCLIADEMGLGKTLQAIAIAACFMNEGSTLVVCPAILRFTWAEELERWLPFCLPADIHLVFGHRDNPAYLERWPRVVVISYTMLHRLRKSMLEREWASLIVDESHHVRCSRKTSETEEIKAVLDVAMKIRRLKEHILVQLPPKRRQIIRLSLERSDIISAKAAIGVVNSDASEKSDAEDMTLENLDESDDSGSYCRRGKLSYQELGIAKLSGFREWLSIHPLVSQSDDTEDLDLPSCHHKMIIFAHHLKVLDGIQEIVCEKGIGFVRIDGSTLPRDRQSAVLSFRSSNEVKIAIIGITAGGIGLDFSSAQNVVFLELPQSPSLMLQAEDRAHRRGQTGSVNIYIFCAKDTMDDSHWQKLNRSLCFVSSTTNGKYGAIQEIPVEGVSYLETSGNSDIGGKDKIFGKAACGKLSTERKELPGSGVASNLQPVEAYDEVAENVNDRLKKPCSSGAGPTERDELDIRAHMVSTVTIAEALIADGTLERNDSEAETRTAERVSPCERNEPSEDNDRPEEGLRFHPSSMVNDAVLAQPIESDKSCLDQVASLRFEMSQYTGRIHLYCCIPEKDLRPRPLFENFRPEDLEPLDDPASGENKGSSFKSLKDNPAYRRVFGAFVNEWNTLRPIDRRKLLGKPLQLPLTLELCYLSESINHNNGGLLKGGSKRRTTPLSEISHPLPLNAMWKKVKLSSGSGKKEKEYSQGWTLTDEPLCKLCQEPCKGNNAKTPEFFEDLFCNLGCFEEFRLRTSNRSLRQELFQIEHGVCAICQLDCHKLVKHIKPLPLSRRQEYIEKVAPNVARRKNLLDKLVNDPVEGNAWHADHIIPVYRGGGECRLENMRTLCVACHSDVTAAQCAERRSTRAKAKKQLQVIMNDLKNVQNIKGTKAKIQNERHSEKQSINEDELLVKVPGSAYSGEKGTITGNEVLEESKV